jgi:hypothetical protein
MGSPPVERCLALVLRLVRRSLGEVGSFSEGGCEAERGRHPRAWLVSDSAKSNTEPLVSVCFVDAHGGKAGAPASPNLMNPSAFKMLCFPPAEDVSLKIF